MRVGWLADQRDVRGGGELTQAELRAAAPAGVEIVDCPPGEIVPDCERYAIHNCALYSVEDIRRATARAAFKYWNDVGNWYPPEMRVLLDGRCTPICCSTLQAEYMGLRKAWLIPPPIDLARFERAAVSVNGDRSGAVCAASWRNAGKAPQRAAEWAQEAGVEIDFYGSGPFAPPGSAQVAYPGMAQLLARYQTFVFLPAVIEPFGRLVAEAWAAGCELVVNGLVGALQWLDDGEAIRTAAADYWEVVLG